MMKKLLISTATATLLFFGNYTVAAEPQLDPKTVIAKVDGQKITMLDIAQLYQSLPPQLQQVPLDKAFPALRSQLVDMVIMAKEAEKKGLEKDEDVKKAIEMAMAKIKQQILVQAYVEKNVKISDKAIRDKYDERVKATKDEQEVKASHILVKTEAEAKEIIKSLDAGAKFDKLAREKSIDKGSAEKGGDLGYFGKEDMVPEFTEAAFKLKTGKYTEEPVKTKFGYHIIWKKDQRKMKPPALKDVHDLLKAQLMQQEIGKLTESLHKKYKIELYAMDGKKVTDAATKEAA